MWQKNRVGEFLVLESFETNEYLSKGNACFIKAFSLTAYQKQTRQVIKITRHRFFRSRCEENVAMVLAFSRR